MAHSDNKNDDIEVLRGLAIIITIYAHLRLLFPWSPEWFESSLAYFSPSVGVDLFFCISGYVITSSLLKDGVGSRDFKSFSIPFWTRRMWRLWPSAWLWVIINLICVYYFNWGGGFGLPINTVYSSISAVTHVANLYFPYCVSNQMCGANMVNWSLSLEEQFYFIFPFMFFFLSRKNLSIFMIVVIGLQFFLNRPAASLLWSIRTDAICSGVLLAIHKEKIISVVESLFKFISKVPYLILAISSVCVSMVPVTEIGSISGVTTFVCFTSVAVAASRVELVKDGYIKKFFIYIGSRSYAIYLCHEVVFRMINEFYAKLDAERRFGSEKEILFSVLATILILAFSEINFRFVEQPLRKVGRKIASKYSLRNPGERVTANN